MLLCFGLLRDFLDTNVDATDTIAHVLWDRPVGKKKGKSKRRPQHIEPAPLIEDSQDFYNRRVYRRIVDIFNRPICSAPGTWIDVMDRAKPHCMALPTHTGRTVRCLNLGSYNYLGFAANDAYCTPRVSQSLRDFGPSACSPAADCGTTTTHVSLERRVASFLGCEAAYVYGMGFATNACTMPLLVSKGCLVVSDEFNHKSIVDGAKLSGASVRVFKHNNMAHLEHILHHAIVQGHPRTRRPWRKILVVVEGVYSMEGELCKLREIVALKQKYKAYLYLDEAHSIGAMGRTGRGVCEHLGVDSTDVDVMMGTFTKSFGSCGGYVAGPKALINHIRRASAGSLYTTTISPPAAQQILSAMAVISGADGTQRGQGKLEQLRANCNYFRQELMRRGFHVLGDEDSPVVPVMCYHSGKIPACSRLALERGLAVVMVGFPATGLFLSRMRICLSAAHTIEDLKYAVRALDDVGSRCRMKYMSPQKKKHAKVGRGGGAEPEGTRLA